MEGAPLSLILDVVILVLLGLTIVYAARLSLQLRRLRDSKSDLDRVVKDLIRNLDRADRAVAGLREAAKESGRDLQDAIDKAQNITDELELMTDSGDRLAARLEQLVDGAKPILNAGASKPLNPTPAVAPAAKPAEQQSEAQRASYAQHLRKLDAAEEKAAVRPMNFNIRDPEVERGMDPLDSKPLEDEGLYSEAERDLYRAVKGKAKA